MADQEQPDVEITEDKTGVYIAICNKCMHVIGVKHTTEELQRARAEHVCAKREKK